MLKTGTASGYADLLNTLNAFLTATGSAYGARRYGVGNGRLTNYTGGANSVAETFTLTATSANTFSVVGSSSGNIGTATVGTPFTSAVLAFTITAGSQGFVAGDSFTLTTAPKWVAMRATAGTEYIWKAPGSDGVSAIYTGAKVYANAGADIYNWELQGFAGFDTNAAFSAQPGAITSTDKPNLALWSGSIPYWFVVNGRRVVVVAKVSNTYHAAYLGLIDQYVDPMTYPYALAVGGSVNGSVRYSDTTYLANCFPFASADLTTYANTKSQMRLRLASGTWQGFLATQNGSYTNAGDQLVWPYHAGMTALRPNLDGTYPLMPIVLHDGSPQVYGQLSGVKATTGFGTGAESIIDEGQAQHLVLPNISRTATNQYFALELD